MKFKAIIKALNQAKGAMQSFRRITEPAHNPGHVHLYVEKGESVYLRKETRK
jgi:hypothetical protein